MKRQVVFLSAAMLSLFSSASFAVTGNQPSGPIKLEPGVTDTQILSSADPKRYEVQIDRDQTIEISSEHFAGESSAVTMIEGELYDASGKLISRDSDTRGHLLISERLQPGTYILEVSGTAMGSADEVSNRYTLHLNVE
ncbi:T9SS type A sorting domain-containing protein [Halomonas beimenensis]|uniref:Uncharacterized protein n=1 Tax=Halomonas beimenensis TaxID=475662 RepID=A0A291P8X5_9GAMM|nr:T9SS type A sorting domain-containing protein [Halomonas beimenensis]ATJ83317.1 hypothetical protein BEI_2330 [Halomonas beimenensis]